MEDRELIAIAMDAKEKAYAPYSNFRVGAAVLCSDGEVYTGCNIENASYPVTICAERCAMSKAISEGKREFVKIAIVSDSNSFTMPCGMCRQFMYEFMPEGEVIVAEKDTIRTYRVSELIPGCFTL